MKKCMGCNADVEKEDLEYYEIVEYVKRRRVKLIICLECHAKVYGDDDRNGDS